MGRPRKPDKVQEISGAWKHDPQRRRKAPVGVRTAGDLGPPPAEWIEKATNSPMYLELLMTWKQIVEQDVLGVLNAAHRLMVENGCHLMYKIRRATRGYGKATSGDYAQVKAILAAMGQTPVDSGRVEGAVRIPGQGNGQSGDHPGGGWGEYVGRTR